MKVLFLHGWKSVPGGVKPTYLKGKGLEVINPALDDNDFAKAVATAQQAFEKHRPAVVVGSSRGGAVAMNLTDRQVPLVLLCPAWKNWGTVKTINSKSVVLHSRMDDVIPFQHSLELIENSNLASGHLLEVGGDHRLADPKSLEEMYQRVLRALGR